MPMLRNRAREALEDTTITAPVEVASFQKCLSPGTTNIHQLIREKAVYTSHRVLSITVDKNPGKTCLPTVMSESLVGISHFMGILTLLNCSTAVIESVNHFACQFIRHGLPGSLR